jgi:hypothetical protein
MSLSKLLWAGLKISGVYAIARGNENEADRDEIVELCFNVMP